MALIGWLCVLGWQVNIGSGSYLTALQIQGIVLLNKPHYVGVLWSGKLIQEFPSNILNHPGTPTMARYPDGDCSCQRLHPFQYILRKKTPTNRRSPPHHSYLRLLRHLDSALGTIAA